jgi:hypothetical protein
MNAMAQQLSHFSPETRRQYEACLKKFGYPTEQDADAARTRRQAVTDEVLRAYACDDCGMWHLTHRPLTSGQVLALADLLTLEMQRFRVAWEQLGVAARPYVKGHVMYRRTPQEIDEAFAVQLDLLDRLFTAWFSLHQRRFALKRARATTAAEARAIDEQAREVLAESLRRRDKDRRDALKLHHTHRSAADEAMNAAFALPSFGWRTHLTR